MNIAAGPRRLVANSTATLGRKSTSDRASDNVAPMFGVIHYLPSAIPPQARFTVNASRPPERAKLVTKLKHAAARIRPAMENTGYARPDGLLDGPAGKRCRRPAAGWSAAGREASSYAQPSQRNRPRSLRATWSRCRTRNAPRPSASWEKTTLKPFSARLRRLIRRAF